MPIRSDDNSALVGVTSPLPPLQELLDPKWEAEARAFIVKIHEEGGDVSKIMRGGGGAKAESDLLLRKQKACPEVKKVSVVGDSHTQSQLLRLIQVSRIFCWNAPGEPWHRDQATASVCACRS